jgi:hypothetical protein
MTRLPGGLAVRSAAPDGEGCAQTAKAHFEAIAALAFEGVIALVAEQAVGAGCHAEEIIESDRSDQAIAAAVDEVGPGRAMDQGQEGQTGLGEVSRQGIGGKVGKGGPLTRENQTGPTVWAWVLSRPGLEGR